jgi:RimJ/RimL family protein N-acetyltransferase
MNSSPFDVQLRNVIESDLPIFFEQQLDPEATQMAAFPPREWEVFMAHWAKILADTTGFIQTILFEGRVAGNIVSWEHSGQREVGYWLGKAYWGKGIATRALAQFLGQVKERPLYAYVARHNIASLRVLQKCGFTIIGEEQEPSSVPGVLVEEIILQLNAPETGPAEAG